MFNQCMEINNMPASTDKMRVLIVDDDPDILESLRDILELDIENCSVELVNNVEQAKLIAQQFHPDIALLDIKIGQDNGLELIPELKSISPDVACIMMTAHRDNEYTVTAVRFGANDYLYKPIKPQEFIQTVTRIFNEQQVKRKILLAEKRFFTVFEQATQWIFLVGPDDCLIDANQTALDFIAGERSDVLGKLFWDTPWYSSSIEAQDIIKKGLAEVKEGSLFNAELTVVEDNECLLTFDLFLKPILNSENKVEQIVVEARNITDRKKAEEGIKELNESLELRVKERTRELEQSLLLIKKENEKRRKAEQAAEKANKAKSDFLSHMSHELRTPMNAVLGFAQLMELDIQELNESQTKSLKEIIYAGNHMLGLINDILELAEIEADKLQISMDKVQLCEVLKQSEVLIQHVAAGRKIEIVDNVSNKGFILYADFFRLKQVFVNLLSNAVKYNRENGSITLDSEVINKQRLRISITDTGEGLSKEDIAKLFTSFERLNAKFNVEGTGIGLIITKNIIELMDGDIGVESTLGTGSTFWIELNIYNEK